MHKTMLCFSLALVGLCISASHAFCTRTWGSHRQVSPIWTRRGALRKHETTILVDAEDQPSRRACMESAAESALKSVKLYTRSALENAGTVEGLIALENLRDLCCKRQPYNFEEGYDAAIDGSIVAPLKQIIPPRATESFLRQVHYLEKNGWMSTNPDSVDGLPSLHLNLISQGKPIVDVENEDADDFQRGIKGLLDIISPHVYESLLPRVQKLMNSSDIVVSDVFLRRYGSNIIGGTTRTGISAHYDVYAKVTAVIALDNVAADGQNGLYTLASYMGETSNHASLRRFFPLKSGDGVIHTWDTLHGVDVQAGLDRTSLIVWFSTCDGMSNGAPNLQGGRVSPWLANHPLLSSNDVVQFVLASALASTTVEEVDGVDAVQTVSMYHERQHKPNESHQYHKLFLASASKMNPFALMRIGSLCRDQALSHHLLLEAQRLSRMFPDAPSNMSPLLHGTRSPHERQARFFWFQGALQGNPLAQIALGDEAMDVALAAGDESLRVLAATLFCLAAQQGVDAGIDALTNVVKYEASISRSEEEFSSSLVVQIANLAAVLSSEMSHLE